MVLFVTMDILQFLQQDIVVVIDAQLLLAPVDGCTGDARR